MTIAVVSCFPLVGGAQAQDIYKFGRLGMRLPAEDVAAITRNLADRGVPWAILGWYSQTLPEVRYVDAFLPPTLATAGLRRGPVVHLKCSPVADEAACVRWEEAAPPTEYAQVADIAGTFSESLSPRTPLERPIRIVGDLLDREILTLVAYIRGSPRPRAEHGWTAMALSGELPIQDMRRESASIIRAWLTLDGGVVHSGRFTQTQQGWQITEVVLGVG
ncbi:MAG TPA: hypothetical protein VMX54_08520 [Vicinamibacteria bacterium]|nr:hypothetical protein [Vicinamibacteria bacterium]